MEPGTLVKLNINKIPLSRYCTMVHNQNRSFTIYPEHIGMYIKTIRFENTPPHGFYDIVLLLIEDSLVEAAPDAIEPLCLQNSV